MKTDFFNALKEGNLQLTRAQLKEINGGNFGSPISDFASASAYCSKSGKTVSCAGTDCTGKDDVGCSCDGGAVSESCKDTQQ